MNLSNPIVTYANHTPPAGLSRSHGIGILAKSLFTIGATILLLTFQSMTLKNVAFASDNGSWVQQLPVQLPAPDLSFLNHQPAGKLGRVYADGPDLFFGDGSPARFWGVNLQAYALFTTNPAAVPLHADRLAAMGVNLVRIHHHDSSWVKPNVLQPAGEAGLLNPASMASLDLWVSTLKSRGIYVWLDLHVGREFNAEDNIEFFEETVNKRGRAKLKGFSYVSASIQERMLEFQRAYLTHKNQYTGLTYAEDPAILGVLITNENDITHHFGNALLPDKNVPRHNAIYMDLANNFAEEHGLRKNQTWRSWQPGASKLFLNDLERTFNERFLADIEKTGFGGLVATTNTWGGNPLYSLPALTTGSIIDIHSYGEPGDLKRDPRNEPGFLNWIAAGQVADMPISVSEWNVSPYPATDRFTAVLRTATSAAHQGWDAPMIYGYSQKSLSKTKAPNNWNVAFDPGIISMMPAAALLYRRGDVSLAQETIALEFAPDLFFGEAINPKTSAAIRSAFERHRIVVVPPRTPELPWMRNIERPVGSRVITDPAESLLGNDVTSVVSDTGEFQRDFLNGVFTVDTPRSQLAAGNLGAGEIELSAVTLTSPNEMAAVAVQSLDMEPIGTSESLMISLVARTEPAGKKDPAFIHEPISGTLHIRANPDLRLYRPGENAQELSDAHQLVDGVHEIDLTKMNGLLWAVLR